jgi:hypothetical protein
MFHNRGLQQKYACSEYLFRNETPAGKEIHKYRIYGIIISMYER